MKLEECFREKDIVCILYSYIWVFLKIWDPQNAWLITQNDLNHHRISLLFSHKYLVNLVIYHQLGGAG